MAELHFVALVTVIVGTGICLLAQGGHAERSLKAVLVAFLPFFFVGILSSLLLSAAGVPTVEWALPGIAVLVLGLFCKSHAVFSAARWALLVASIGLCGNFIELTSSGYTAKPVVIQSVSSTMQKAIVRGEQKKLREHHAPEATLPAGPVQQLTLYATVAEWHTPLTQLHRVTKQPAVVWYPGGPVAESVDKLQIKTL
jgi:hypothetical protein